MSEYLIERYFAPVKGLLERVGIHIDLAVFVCIQHVIRFQVTRLENQTKQVETLEVE